MIRKIFAVLAITAAWLPVAALSLDPVPIRPTARPEHGLSVACQIVDVHDGDTVTVEITRRIRVRLLDCWAPEVIGREKPEGLKSRDALRALALRKMGTLYIPTEGNDQLGDVMTFDRVLGHIWLDEDPSENLSQKQVRKSYATRTKQAKPAE